MEVVFSEAVNALAKAVVLIVVLFEDEDLTGRIEQISINSRHFIKYAVSESKIKSRDFGDTQFLVVPDGIEGYPEVKSILLVNAGKSKEFDYRASERLGGKIYQAVNKLKLSEVTVILEHSSQSVISYVANGMLLRDFTFGKYKTKREKVEPVLKKAVFVVDAQEHCLKEFQYLSAITYGNHLARSFTTEPPNILYPDAYAQNIREIFRKFGNVKVDVLDEKAMSKLGMNALLGVGRASEYESRLVTIQFNGSADKSSGPIAFVGKGVTFDTGGISLKPSRNMWDMKYDMAGSAAVIGALYGLAERGANVNAVGVVGLVENAVSGSAQRPSDVVKSMSGKTIEVLNTDAEGRLVLADALYYTQEFFKPEIIIDVATLTGAVVVALGDQYAGLFANDDNLAEQISASGNSVAEAVWRFPLSEAYDKQMDSDIADMQNISLKGSGADSITAAQFLQRFINPQQKWAHIDIAGVAWDKTGSDVSSKGATGFGVRLLNELSRKYYEN